jgi:hypothetical protein
MVPHAPGLCLGQDIVRHGNGVVEPAEFRGGAVQMHSVNHQRNWHDAEGDVPKDVAWDEGQRPE